MPTNLPSSEATRSIEVVIDENFFSYDGETGIGRVIVPSSITDGRVTMYRTGSDVGSLQERLSRDLDQALIDASNISSQNASSTDPPNDPRLPRIVQANMSQVCNAWLSRNPLEGLTNSPQFEDRVTLYLADPDSMQFSGLTVAKAWYLTEIDGYRGDGKEARMVTAGLTQAVPKCLRMLEALPCPEGVTRRAWQIFGRRAVEDVGHRARDYAGGEVDVGGESYETAIPWELDNVALTRRDEPNCIGVRSRFKHDTRGMGATKTYVYDLTKESISSGYASIDNEKDGFDETILLEQIEAQTGATRPAVNGTV